MDLQKEIAIIGGDLRLIKLAQMIQKDGHTVHTFGLERAQELNNTKCNSLKDALDCSSIIIAPVPLSSNGEYINAPFSENKISIKELLENMQGKILIAGSIKQEIYKQAEQNNIKVIDMLKREELAVLNAISTAEGAIQIAIQETARTIHGSEVLVLGFGRIGKVLAKMLGGIGARVSCEARKDADLAWIKAYGYEPIPLDKLKDNLGRFDVIINTIPYMVLDKENLNEVNKDCLIIDLASNPGGVDRVAVKEKKIKFNWALSLPGKVAPITSAEFIKETLYNILKEEQN